MSSPTWTPAALSSEARRLQGTCWRLVEAQHRVSTWKLVDTLEEQDLLERLIEDAKPPVPEECRHLHYLLATPFRYGAIYPTGSHFRRAGMTPGVYYAAERVTTAVAEMAFYRLLFFAESPDMPWPANPAEHTAFAADYACANGLDLTAPPFNAQSALWRHPTDYGPCQDLADAARVAAIEIIRYGSARDPGSGANVALLTCRAFTSAEPKERQTWRVYLRASGAQAICEFPAIRLAFDHESFANDPRIAAMRWER